MARNARGLLDGQNLLSAMGYKEFGGVPASSLNFEEMAKNQFSKVSDGDQPGSAKAKINKVYERRSAGPAPNSEIIRLLKLAGYDVKDDPAVEGDESLDEKQFQSRQIPQLEALQAFQQDRPSELDLSGVAMLGSMLSSTGMKVQAPKPGRTAEDNLSDYASLGKAIQGERDNEMKRQADMLKTITGVTDISEHIKDTDNSDYSVANPQPPAPRAGKGPAKPKGLTAAQQKEIEQYNDAIKEAQTVVQLLGKNTNYVGPADALKLNMFLGKGHAAFRQQLGLLMDPYRSKVTGQAAADKELARIEGRLPKESDKFENFGSKAENYIRYMQEARDRRLQTYQNQGIDTSAFITPGGTQSAPPPPAPGKSARDRAAAILQKKLGGKQ